MKFTNSLLAAAGMLAMASAQMPESSVIFITKTKYETSTSTLTLMPSISRNIPTYTSTVEVTSMVVVTVTSMGAFTTSSVTGVKAVAPYPPQTSGGWNSTVTMTETGTGTGTGTLSGTGTGIFFPVLPTESPVGATDTITQSDASPMVGPTGSSMSPPSIYTITVTQTVPEEVPTMSASTSSTSVADDSASTSELGLVGKGASPTGNGPASPDSSTVVPTAPSVSLAPVLSSALATLTSTMVPDALTSIVPTASVNPIISSIIQSLTSAIPTSVLPTGVTAPTALPSAYDNGTTLASSDAPPKGMTMQQLLQWIAYLLERLSKGKSDSDDVPSSKSKRAHARDLAQK